MARRSEEQKQDLKVKLVVGTILVVVVGVAYGLGPGLPRILEQARQRKTEPWAAKRYYDVARLYTFTMREPKAQELYEEFYLTFGGRDWELDFEPIITEIYGNAEDADRNASYLPWVANRYDGLPGIDEGDPDIKNRRPAPVSKERHPLTGKVLYHIAMHWEGERDYIKSNHLWSVLFHMWPEGSFERTEAEKAKKRAMQRSF